MQVSAVNSTNFGNSYYTDMSRSDIEKAEQISLAMRKCNDAFFSSEDKPKRKNILGIIASVGVGLVGTFLIAKKGLKSAETVAESIKKINIVQKATEKIAKTKPVQDAKVTFELFKRNYSLGKKATNFVDKYGRDNVIAGIASLGTTAYVATTDGNGDGIPDIAEKGVNAYKNTLGRVDAIKDFIDLVS